ncbi:type I polyketide synthase [Allorhizobium undicola]|uniref:type I polyketide synthase n=1 Tax=Allorhizobium undicola TaxID=78527 RepID=UPI000484E300|nr:type I polyketide synthase [Allorhizobium undicola]
METKSAATPLTRALDTIRKLKAELDARGTRQPLAIIGVGMRFPGGIDDLATYWQALSEGRNLVARMPEKRRARFAEEWESLPHKGGFLEDVTGFDAAFFGISPREAKALDPQHRLLLEVSQQALDDAGLAPERLKDATTGVFIGITGQDYRDWQGDDPDAYWATGNGHCFAAGRISYTLGLTGPAMAVDTACSSSLVAVHLAAQAIRRGECDVALAGGVNLILSPRSTRLVRETRSLSPDGLCKAFDARANGFTRGEGGGMLVLKKLDQALADGDRVLAVLHGSALNQDGRSSGFTAPNVLAQTRLLEAALADAGLQPADIGYIETHGTGTSLGDPIEMEAIVGAIAGKTDGAPLHIGAVKTNIGHLEAAAGVAGLIKAIACLRHGALAPIVHFETLNPRIDVSGTGIGFPRSVTPWGAAGAYAGISSFGMSGTNAHIILGPAPAVEPVKADIAGFEISARSQGQLASLAADYRQRLEALDDSAYPAFAYTASFGRARQPERVFISAKNRSEALAALAVLAAGGSSPAILTGPAIPAIDPASLPRQVVSLPGYPFDRQQHAPALTQAKAEKVRFEGESITAATPSPQPSEHHAEPPALHVIEWQKATAPAVSAGGPTLVLAGDDEAVLAPLAARAAALGCTFERASVSALSIGAPVLAGKEKRVILLGLLAPPLPEAVDGEDIAARGAAFCAEIVEALRAAQACGGRLHVITRGQHCVLPDERLFPSHQALLHGLSPVLGLEYPEAWGGIVDISASGFSQNVEAEAAGILTHALAGGVEDLVAVREGTVYLARLARAPASFRPALPVKPDATYLMTGGLGGIGRATAMQLARSGARHLLLIGRTAGSALSQEALRGLDDLAALGVTARYVAADCDDGKALENAISQALETMPALGGIIHAAGSLAPMPVARLDAKGFEAALRGKYSGAWWLHLIARRYRPDFFVTLSSVTAVWGTEGYAAYGAANGGLMAAVGAETSDGRAAASIAYGPWALDGMADAAARATFERLGVSALDAGAGIAALTATSPRPGSELIACDVHWDRFRDVIGSRRKRGIFDNLGEKARMNISHSPAATAILSLPLKARAAAAREEVRKIVAAILGFADGAAVQNDVGFFDLGLDSIMAVDLAQAISAAFEIDLSAAAILDNASVTSLAAHVVEQLASRPAALAPQAPVAPIMPPAVLPPLPPLGTYAPPQEARANAVFGAGREPIAIIGMAGRFPGADTLEEFWQVLAEGRDTVGKVPTERFDVTGLHDADPLARGRITTDQGGFLSDLSRFDAHFFNIPAREAESLDPQQRLLLETAWHALEHANIDPRSLKGTATGVFLGISNSDYARLLEEGGLGELDAYFGTGTALNANAGRISYNLGLNGPALAVDTACSSSLVALHLALRSLRSGESDCALAGGVNVITAPSCSVAVSRAHMLSPDGRCKTFSADANGFVRAEGVGMVVLKRLADARRDGDTVLAVLRGSAVNHDGASSGLTVPSGKAQQAVIAAALADAGLAASRVSYLEAHGTGTSLGDPIEVDAAHAVLGAGRAANEPLRLGSVKSNIGHAESASGMASIIKTVLALQNRTLPASLHSGSLNPHIRWSDLNVEVVRQLTPWESRETRVAGISGFGFSGTNAHVIVEEYRDADALPVMAADGPFLLPLSAPDADGLERLTAGWAARLKQGGDGNPAGLVAAAGKGRAHFARRRAITAKGRDELIAALESAKPAHDGLEEPRIAFLFSGQGSQYFGMGRELYETEPVFRAVIDDCDRILAPHFAGRSLREFILFGADKEAINQTWITQPALVALELALAELWKAYGVTASIVLGHSVGEIAAAIYAGVLDRASGLALIATRARLMQSAERGAMLAISAPADAVSGWIAGTTLDIAVINGPEATVVAGLQAEIDALAERLKAEKIMARPLTVSHAFHSRMMEPVLGELEARISAFAYGAPEIPIVSNVTGKLAGPAEYNAAYWCRHVRQAVRFSDGLQALAGFGVDLCLEIGPDKTLAHLTTAAGLAPRRGATHSLKRGVSDRQIMLAAVKTLYEAGQDFDFAAVNAYLHAPALSAPLYPFAETRYWTKVRPAARQAAASAGPRRHWGREVRSPAIHGRVFSFERDCHFPAYLTDHRLYGTVVTPVASHLGTVFSALAASGKRVVIEDMICPRALVILDGESFETQIIIGEGANPDLAVKSLIDPGQGIWQDHLMGRLADKAPRAGLTVDRQAFIASAERHISGEDFYAHFRSLGYTLGPSFRWIADVWIRGEEAVLRYAQPDLPDARNDYEIYPGLIDSLFQSIAGFMVDDTGDEAPSLAIPFSAARLSLHRPAPAGSELWGFVRIGKADPLPNGRLRVETADLHLFDAEGRSYLSVDDFRVRHAPRELLQRSLKRGVDHAYRLAWKRHEPVAAPALPSLAVLGPLAAVGGLEEWLSGKGLATGQAVELASRILDLSFATIGSVSAADVEHAVVQLAENIRNAPRQTPYIVLADGRVEASPLRQALWGMLTALEAEAADRRLVRITLSPEARIEDIGAAITGEITETRFSIEAGGVQAARLQPIEEQAPQWQLNGSVLVTGGLGALGLSVAAMAAASGARGIVLMGRSQPDEVTRRVISDLQAGGTAVVTVAGDITNPQDCTRAIDAARVIAPLEAIFHLAGITDDQAFERITPESFARVFSAKVRGAEVLLKAAEDETKAKLVFFSSVSASLGSAGQASYAAANGYLDGLAHALRARGVNATSISWGPWVPAAKGGLAAAGPAAKAAERLGVHVITDDMALPLLSLAAAGGETHIVAVSADFQAFAASMGHHPRAATLESLAGTAGAPGKGGEADLRAKGWLAQELGPLDPEDRAERLHEVLSDMVGEAIGDRDAVTDETGFADIGLDSIMAIDLRAKLAQALNTDLPATIAIDYPNLPLLSGFLLQLLPVAGEEPDKEQAGTVAPATEGETSQQSLEDLIRAVKDDLANF